MRKKHLFLLLMTTLAACNAPGHKEQKEEAARGSFGYDKAFILKYDSTAVLLGKGDAQVLVSPKYQAKVFTSTAEGDSGHSFGWIHYSAFDGPLDAHMNAYGGENRFWLGPEGGAFSMFFEKGAAQQFEHWHTPAAYDSEAWDLVSIGDTTAGFRKDMQLRNYAGTAFSVRVDRKVSLLAQPAFGLLLGVNCPPGVKAVGYRTENTVTNTGPAAWDEKTGMPCTWILDMFPPSDKTTIVIPYKAGEGSPATTTYFGEIPADRIKTANNTLYFKADGKQRGKLGIHPGRAKSVAGSYDANNHILTIVLFDVNPLGRYLNQEWRTDKPVFSGDAVNAYNDGPVAGGKQLGPFYELESVSTAHFLPPGHSGTHWHSVFHFTGSESGLDFISKKVLGVTINDIKQAL